MAKLRSAKCLTGTSQQLVTSLLRVVEGKLNFKRTRKVTLHGIKHQIASDTSNKVCLFGQGADALGIKMPLAVRVTNSFPAVAVSD